MITEFIIDRCPFWWPCQMEVASCGVYPMNHAFVSSLAVPVLPAASRPLSCAFSPVAPWDMTFLRTSVVWWATLLSNTCRQSGFLVMMVLPSASLTSV